MTSEAGTGTVVIERRQNWAWSGRGLDVYLDGRTTGLSVWVGQPVQLEVDAAAHVLQVRVSRARSNAEAFDIRDRQSLRFQCGIDNSGWKRVLKFMPWKHETLYLIRIPEDMPNHARIEPS